MPLGFTPFCSTGLLLLPSLPPLSLSLSPSLSHSPWSLFLSSSQCPCFLLSPFPLKTAEKHGSFSIKISYSSPNPPALGNRVRSLPMREKTKAVTRRKTHTQRHTNREKAGSRPTPLRLGPTTGNLRGKAYATRQSSQASFCMSVIFFSLHYEPADSCSIGHSLLCRCTRQRREEGGSVPIRPFVFACTHRGEGDAGMRLSGSRLQPAAAAK